MTTAANNATPATETPSAVVIERAATGSVIEFLESQFLMVRWRGYGPITVWEIVEIQNHGHYREDEHHVIGSGESLSEAMTEAMRRKGYSPNVEVSGPPPVTPESKQSATGGFAAPNG